MSRPSFLQLFRIPRADRLRQIEEQINFLAATGRLFDMDDPQINALLDERDEIDREINPHKHDPLKFLKEEQAGWEEDADG